MYAPATTNAPWARLTTFMTPHTREKPTAIEREQPSLEQAVSGGLGEPAHTLAPGHFIGASAVSFGHTETGLPPWIWMTPIFLVRFWPLS